MSDGESTLTMSARMAFAAGYALVTYTGEGGTTYTFFFPAGDVDKWVPILKVLIEAGLNVIEGVDTVSPSGYA